MFSCSCISLISMILRESRLLIVHFDILKINSCSYRHTGPISLRRSNLKGILEDHHQSCVNFLFCLYILVIYNWTWYLFLRSAQVSDAYGACAPIETLTSWRRWFWAPLKESLDRYFTYVNLTKSIDLTPIEVRTSRNLRYVTTHIEMDTLLADI